MTTAIAAPPARTDQPIDQDNPCIACGACCAYYRVSFYCGELTGGSGGYVPVELTSKVNSVMACMKGTEAGHGRCVALEGELGRSGIRCRIYAQRPSTCREFDAWHADGAPNPDCQGLRERIGLPALAPRAPAAQ
jgi:Fe-S-cluster containining protein